jgi:hypothetical protein
VINLGGSVGSWQSDVVQQHMRTYAAGKGFGDPCFADISSEHQKPARQHADDEAN